MKKLNYALIRERLSYPSPSTNGTAEPRRGVEWKLHDSFGNRFGRFMVRSAPDATWRDVFGHEVHQSGHIAGTGFAICAQALGETFTLYRCTPSGPPLELYRQRERVELRGLSANERFIAVDAAHNGNPLRPKALVLDLRGDAVAEIAEVGSSAGCWAGAWSPIPGDNRLIVHHEAEGWLRPAIWTPHRNTLVRIEPDLAGEVRAFWGATTDTIFLHRNLEGHSDLHRYDVASGQFTTIQPLDGVVLRPSIDETGEVVGVWSANHAFACAFRGSNRLPHTTFQPSTPLHRMAVRRIADVPCITTGLIGDSRRWTIIEGYGNYAYHHRNIHNWVVNVLADHDFQVVQVNTRGCNGFGRAWREASLENIGFCELEDMRHVRAALIAEGSVHPDRLVLAGSSWGGYMALLGAGIQPDLWRVVVACTPIADWLRTYEEATPLEVTVNRLYFRGTPENQAERFRRASPMTYIDQIRAPVYLECGSHDLLCPPSQNVAFADALRGRGHHCDFHLYKGGHGPTDPQTRLEQMNRLMEFLVRYCT